jgi:ribosome silencing factor RsfS/YbeB/iojap/nicotinate (nicotinamide) nucleotide adenylyltransferase
MASFAKRFAMARFQARHPRILVTDLEVRLGTQFTFDTLAALSRYYPHTRFVWLMGADNLGQIHRWQHWRGIFQNIPIAVFDRPPYRLQTLAGPAAAAYAKYRRDPAKARDLVSLVPPAWTFFPSRLEPLSSSQLRQAARSFGPDSLRARFAASTFKETDPHMVTSSMGKTPAEKPPAELRKKTARKKPAAETVGTPVKADPSPEAVRDLVVKSIDDDKGEDIVVVDLQGRSNLADYIVIASGRSARQVGAMAEHLLRNLQPELSFRMTVEGLPQGDWVLLDCGDVVVHLFRPEVRDFYAIEKMWGLEPPAPKVSEAS